MQVDETTKAFIRKAMESHKSCDHIGEPEMCHMLILGEAAIRRGYAIEDEEELDACGRYIADYVLESLILKGVVEPFGVDEEGRMTVRVTEKYSNEEEGY